jgi:hypothetical protein
MTANQQARNDKTWIITLDTEAPNVAQALIKGLLGVFILTTYEDGAARVAQRMPGVLVISPNSNLVKISTAVEQQSHETAFQEAA